MMLFVYTLISRQSDYYDVQAYMSMQSLKRHNPDARIVLLTDFDTAAKLRLERSDIAEIASQIVIVDVPAELSDTAKSRFLKTSVRRLVKGDLVYIDNDTIILGELQNLWALPIELGLVADAHKSLGNNRQTKVDVRDGGKLRVNAPYFNTGVIFARDTYDVHLFYRKWHQEWLENWSQREHPVDQPSFAVANKKKGLASEIDGIYNCQIALGPSPDIVANAKILHYFSSVPSAKVFPLNNELVLHSIKDREFTPLIDVLLWNPFMFFPKDIYVIGNDRMEEYFSPMAILGRNLGKRLKFTNKIASWFLPRNKKR